jgi:tetratricopeptide (TPR) repeat protein
MGKLTVVITIVLSFLVPCHSKIYAKDIDPDKARQLFRKAEILYSQHEIDLALKNYLAAIDLFPSMPKAYYRIGVIYSTFKERYYKSIRFFRKSIKYDSQDPNPYHGLGITYCIIGNERLGSKYLMKAGIIFFKEGNIDAALSIYDVLRQTGEPDPILGKMLDEPTRVKIPPSLREEHPADSRERNPLSVYRRKREAFLHPIILKAATRYKVDSALIKAIIMAESSYNPKAISKKGAKGLMQLMPKTAKLLGVTDSFNPEQNINAGVRHFKGLLNEFKGDVKLALAAYHAGSRKVWEYQGVPPFKTTRYYIKKVFEYHQYYKEKTAL